MDADTITYGSASNEHFSAGEMEAGGDITLEVESATRILTRVKLDLARSAEKLVNLDILVLHVVARELDFETFVIVEECASDGCVEKALEFDLLSGLLDSVVRELDSFLFTLRTEILSFHGIMSSFEVAFKEMEENMKDCEESLKQSFEHVSEIKVQSANFQRILTTVGDENWKDGQEVASFENSHLLNLNTSIKMQTAEQQRYILRMLERSLARELELEKKLTESRETEEELKLKLQREVHYIVEESEVTCERLFEAEYTAEILLGISKELLRRIQIIQFNLDGSVQREGELKSKLQNSESTIKDMENLIEDLRSKVSKAESQTERTKEKRTVLPEYTCKLRSNKLSKG